MRQFFITVFGTIVGIFIGMFLLFLVIIGLAAAFSPKEVLPSSVVLDINLQTPLTDHSSGGELFGNIPSIVDIVQKLEQAKTDDKVKGVFIRANPYSMAPAQADEFRLAVLDFKQSGKFVVAHAQGFEGTSLSHYVAVSASDDIWLQDTATFSIAGYRAETPFYGGVFEKFDAKPQFEQFEEYKNAANIYTQTDYTNAHREATSALLGSLFDSAISYISADRAPSAADVELWLENAPHSAEAALEAGYVDTLGHYASAREHALEKAGDNAKFVGIADYSIKYISGDVIAFVGGQGTIMTGKSTYPSPFSSSLTMGSDSVSEALTQAAEDDKVKAIILRIDSGGGSAIASDQMWDAVIRAQEAGKPVIVSMGQYAASGGYYMAAPADKIIALPTTITGSIGVLGGKIVLDETFDKVGYNVEAISVGGDYTGVFSATENWDQKTRAAFRQSMADIYEDFTSRVAQGRSLPIEDVLNIAKGRVWTGEQAIEIGLVDELGGLSAAITAAKEASGIDADTAVRLRQFPGPKTAFEELEMILGASAALGQNAEDLTALLSNPQVQEILRAGEQMGSVTSMQDQSLVALTPTIQ